MVGNLPLLARVPEIHPMMHGMYHFLLVSAPNVLTLGDYTGFSPLFLTFSTRE